MKTETDARQSPLARPFEAGTHLVLALECARPREGSVRVRLDRASEVRIGRADRRRVEHRSTGGETVTEIWVPDARMSSEHARLVRPHESSDGWRVEDRGSKNGTFLNGVTITSSAPLSDGDICRFGQTLFVFRHRWPTDPDAAEVLESITGAAALTTLVPTLARRFDDLARIAASDVPVILLGETGVGKEVMANAIHALSRRRGAFVSVNCGALPRLLVESALFGHKRGAFSGAIADHLGVFREAEGGTILLDEIGDLPLDVQVVLLRALQEHEVTPVGASRPVKVDVRVIAATNRNVEALVGAGTFREDLFARLAGFVLRVPPLRERREDLGLLVGALLKDLAPARPLSFTSAAGEVLFAHDWPRNVRELEKCLTRACALAVADEIDVPQLELPAPLERAASRSPQPPDDEERRAQVLAALQAHKGNIFWVAKTLKTSRTQVHRWLKKFGLSADDYRS